MSVDKRGIIVSVILLAIAFIFVAGVGSVITGKYVVGPTYEVELSLGEEAKVLGHTVKLEKVSIATLDNDNQDPNARQWGVLVVVDGQISDGVSDFLKEGGKTRVINTLRFYLPPNGVKYPEDPKATKVKLIVSTGFDVPVANVITAYPSPFIKNQDYNNLAIVLPNGFSADEKEAAMIIAKGLQGKKRLLPKIIIEKELKNSEGMNLIVIGKACENELIAKLMRTNACNLGFLKDNEGYIEYLPQGNKPEMGALVITGYSDIDTIKSAIVISHNEFYVLESNKVIVRGDISNGVYGLEVEELMSQPYRKA